MNIQVNSVFNHFAFQSVKKNMPNILYFEIRRMEQFITAHQGGLRGFKPHRGDRFIARPDAPNKDRIEIIIPFLQNAKQMKRAKSTDFALPENPGNFNMTRLFAGQCLFNRGGDFLAFRLFPRLKTGNDIAVAADQELGEVPADIA